MTASPTPAPLSRLAITVRGVVQGVGFRPFVFHLARRLSLAGEVFNQSDSVEIEVEGAADSLDAFVTALRAEAPAAAAIESVAVRKIPPSGLGGPFCITASPAEGVRRPATPADLATCDACRAEIADPAARRHDYPFTNCTNCGPRWSIVTALPYDRPSTSMATFAMCPACRAEYADPADRRFHAQPIACPVCGPHLELLDSAAQLLATKTEALDRAAAAVGQGAIVAIKGLGGFQLVVDATNEDAVTRLRQRKHRPDKPLAVMLATLDEVRRRCLVSRAEEQELTSARAPIVLLGLRDSASDIAPAVAPGNPYLGVMLPYTPLHHLLMARVSRPIVCTSGNRSEEPMAVETAEAVERLGSIADLVLTHNRPIVRPVDDSVVQFGAAGRTIVRRARGFAPQPIRLEPDDGRIVLAVGGHLKNTVALCLGGQVIVSPHIGDLDNLLGVEVHRRAVDDLLTFFAVRPDLVVCDLHPDYASTRVAEELAARFAVPLVRVQHHRAHAAACAAEHRIEGPALAFSWDGTGWGEDGTVWGGECLELDGATCRRVAHLRHFRLAGGDQAVRQPRRSALGLLFEIDPKLAEGWAESAFTPAERGPMLALLRTGRHAPATSSMGRLFDGVAALCGLHGTVSFEGQAAMALEYAADPRVSDGYVFILNDGKPLAADWRGLVQQILVDRAAGVAVSVISARFHRALAGLAVQLAERAGLKQVLLTGGCFHNRLLAGLVRQRLEQAGFRVYEQQLVPPGDGGIAFGQIAAARHRQDPLQAGASHVLGCAR